MDIVFLLISFPFISIPSSLKENVGLFKTSILHSIQKYLKYAYAEIKMEQHLNSEEGGSRPFRPPPPGASMA